MARDVQRKTEPSTDRPTRGIREAAATRPPPRTSLDALAQTVRDHAKPSPLADLAASSPSPVFPAVVQRMRRVTKLTSAAGLSGLWSRQYNPMISNLTRRWIQIRERHAFANYMAEQVWRHSASTNDPFAKMDIGHPEAFPNKMFELAIKQKLLTEKESRLFHDDPRNFSLESTKQNRGDNKRNKPRSTQYSQEKLQDFAERVRNNNKIMNSQAYVEANKIQWKTDFKTATYNEKFFGGQHNILKSLERSTNKLVEIYGSYSKFFTETDYKNHQPAQADLLKATYRIYDLRKRIQPDRIPPTLQANIDAAIALTDGITTAVTANEPRPTRDRLRRRLADRALAPAPAAPRPAPSTGNPNADPRDVDELVRFIDGSSAQGRDDEKRPRKGRNKK